MAPRNFNNTPQKYTLHSPQYPGMKTLLLIIAVNFSLLLQAQFIPLHRDVDYPPLNCITPDRNYQLKPDQSRNYLSKFTSYKIETREPTTGIWNSTDSVVCFYNAQLIITSQIDYKSEQGTWQYRQKGDFLTDSNGNPKATIIYTRQKASGGWLSVSEKDYTFDTSRHLIQELERYRVPRLNALRNQKRSQYTYNAKGNEVLHLQQIWDTVSENWINEVQEVSTFDAANHKISLLQQYWDKGAETWRNNWLYTYTNDTFGNHLTELKQEWDNKAWQNKSKCSYKYDSINRQIAQENNLWNSTGKSWFLNGFENWAYGLKNSQRTLEESGWHSSNPKDTIRHYTRDLRTFDADSNMLNRVAMNLRKGEWLLHNHDSATFDNYGNLTYILNYEKFGMNNLDYRVTRIFYYYSPYNSPDGENINQLRASLKPNPSNAPEVYLQLNAENTTTVNIRITDATGKKLSDENRPLQPGLSMVQLTYTGFTAGIYYIVITEPASKKKSTLQWILK